MIHIGRFTRADRSEWQVLSRGYLDFYERTIPAEMYDRARNEFQEDTRMRALAAGELPEH